MVSTHSKLDFLYDKEIVEFRTREGQVDRLVLELFFVVSAIPSIVKPNVHPKFFTVISSTTTLLIRYVVDRNLHCPRPYPNTQSSRTGSLRRYHNVCGALHLHQSHVSHVTLNSMLHSRKDGGANGGAWQCYNTSASPSFFEVSSLLFACAQPQFQSSFFK